MRGSVDEYTANGQDLYYMRHQFTSWLTCRAPRCAFDILVLRCMDIVPVHVHVPMCMRLYPNMALCTHMLYT